MSTTDNPPYEMCGTEELWLYGTHRASAIDVCKRFVPLDTSAIPQNGPFHAVREDFHTLADEQQSPIVGIFGNHLGQGNHRT